MPILMILVFQNMQATLEVYVTRNMINMCWINEYELWHADISAKSLTDIGNGPAWGYNYAEVTIQNDAENSSGINTLAKGLIQLKAEYIYIYIYIYIWECHIRCMYIMVRECLQTVI